VTGPDHLEKSRRTWIGRVFAGLRNNFLTGVVVIAPIGLTVWLIWTLVGWVDSVVLPFVPGAYHPEALANRWFVPEGGTPISVNVRGLGVVVFLIFTIIVGWVAKGLVGRSFLRWGEDIVGRLPVIRSIYNALKQISETVFSQKETSFQKACLIPFPRDGSWALAFISIPAKGEIHAKLSDGDEVVTVFLPTTPNPTSGFLIFVPRKDVHELDMSIEDVAKLIISAGLVYPAGQPAPSPDAIPLPVKQTLRQPAP
jgi:uncharacterized membrane protein